VRVQGEFRYKKTEEKSVEVKTLDISHGSCEVGRKTQIMKGED
jgi:hypothetical protein